MCKQDISSTAQLMPELTPEHRLEAEVLYYQQAGDTILQNVVPSNLLVKRLNQEDHSIAHQVRLGLRTALLGFGLFTVRPSRTYRQSLEVVRKLDALYSVSGLDLI